MGLLYGPALHNLFVYDDLPQVSENPAIRSLAAALTYFTHVVPFSADYLSPAGAFYRPLFWLSLSLDYAAWGEDPTGFHLTNLLLHWACGVLLFRLLGRLGFSRVFVIGVPLVWMALPVNAEVVAWISGRPFSLATAFMLSGLLALGMYIARPRMPILAVIALLFLSALLSHEIGMLLPLLSLVVMTRIGLPSRGRGWLFLAYLAPLVAYLVLRASGGSGFVFPGAGDVFESLRRVPLLVGRYAKWVLVPPRLSVERSADWSALTASGIAYAAAWLGLAGTVTATALAWRRWPEWGFGIAWFAVGLLLFLNLVPLSQGMAERYVYLASIGLVIAIASVTERACLRGWTTGSIAALVVMAASGWYAWRVTMRVPEWHDEWSVYQTSLEATPRSHVLRYNLAVKYAEADQFGSAEALYREAIALQPGYLAAKVNLANLLQRRGEFAEARRVYLEVLAQQPDRKEALLNLANLYQQTGDVAQAEAGYRAALAVDPGYVEAKLNLGALWQVMGKLDQARTAYEDVLARDPAQPQAHLNLGVLLFHRDENEPAIEHLRHALRLRPGYAEAHFNLGVIYQTVGDIAQARREYLQALEIRPDYHKARANLGALETR